jgi:amino acid transporter
VNEAAGFRRAVSRWEIVGLALNDVIGSGVYLLPAAAAAVLGTASIWAVLAAGAAVLLLVLCFAEAAGHFDTPGSAIVYAREAWGELVSFEVGWMTWLARVSSVASLSVGFAQALAFLVPAASAGVGRLAAILMPVLGLTAINVVGVKQGARTGVALTIGKVVPLVVYVAAGIFAVSWSRVTAPAAIQPARLGEAALLLMFAYAGFENTAAPAGEYKNPKRDVPFALITEIAIVTAIYAAVQLVALGTLPGLATSESPLADSARLFLGPWSGVLMTIGAVLSILGTNSGTVLAGPRYLYALAKEGFGPSALERLHPRFGTPANAILLQCAIVLPLTLTGTFTELAALSVVARLTTYISTAAAVPVLRRKLGPPAAFRVPGGPVIPIAACLVCLALAASATKRNLIAGANAIALGGVLYAFRLKRA